MAYNSLPVWVFDSAVPVVPAMYNAEVEHTAVLSLCPKEKMVSTAGSDPKIPVYVDLWQTRDEVICFRAWEILSSACSVTSLDDKFDS
jgi:hypothetical protein